MGLEEREVFCPCCGECISLLLDLSAGDQDYVEDCSVCCRPMRVQFSVADDELAGLQVEAAG